MGLPRALKAHHHGELEEARGHYQRALEQGERNPVLFQNYGALLRESGDHEAAQRVYTQGLAIHPGHAGIRTNRANLLYERAPSTSIQDLLVALRMRLAAGEKPADCRDLFRSLISLQRELGHSAWALATASAALRLLGPDPMLLGQLLILIDGVHLDLDVNDVARLALLSQLEQRIDQCEPRQQAELRLALASHDLGKGELSRALSRFEQGLAALTTAPPADVSEAQARQKLVDVNSWNFGCALLKAQQLARGWQLYDYGLRTPAEGRQRWQRALQKPFAASELPIWRGESLAGKRLLLLEEQAIGDVMMFISLVPVLQQEAAGIGLMLGERLLPIYRRCFGSSLQVWSHADALAGRFSPADYDYQCPVGSICQHRFTDVQQYAPLVPMLQATPKRRAQLRQAYLQAGGMTAQRLVGISWQGGGKPGRIRQKSVSPDTFAQLFQPLPGVRFVSLQYGKAGPKVEQWRREGCDVIHDPRVDALRDMDLWLDQVAACDAVISVANTTIHGAGGLNIPTLCLLSKQSDWRWFDAPEVTRSYWYPSVGVVREEKERGWDAAIAGARAWLEQGCPMPDGPIQSEFLEPCGAK